MNTLEQYLAQLGLNITASTVYDIVKSGISRGMSRPEISQEIERKLILQGIDVNGEKLVEFLAENGDIEIIGSEIKAKNSILFGSGPTTKFTFGDNSESKTLQTAIIAGKGARIVGQGGAQIRQGEDGSISFWT